MKSFFKNLDMKSWLILILLGICIFFGLKWYFSTDGESDAKIEQLEKENADLKIEIEGNIKLINVLELEVTNLEKVIEVKLEIIDSLDSMVSELDESILVTKGLLLEMQKELKEKKEKIEELKKNPFERTGDALLESLKNKLND